MLNSGVRNSKQNRTAPLAPSYEVGLRVTLPGMTFLAKCGTINSIGKAINDFTEQNKK